MAAPKGNQYAKGCTTSGTPKIHTKEFIEKVRKDMEKWVKKPSSLFLEQFTGEMEYFVDPKKLSEWASKHEEFSETLTKVKKTLLSRLKVGSVTKSYDGGFVSKILPMIDEDYRAWRREELNLQKEAQAQLLTEIVNYKGASNKKQKEEGDE